MFPLMLTVLNREYSTSDYHPYQEGTCQETQFAAWNQHVLTLEAGIIYLGDVQCAPCLYLGDSAFLQFIIRLTRLLLPTGDAMKPTPDSRPYSTLSRHEAGFILL